MFKEIQITEVSICTALMKNFADKIVSRPYEDKFENKVKCYKTEPPDEYLDDIKIYLKMKK